MTKAKKKTSKKPSKKQPEKKASETPEEPRRGKGQPTKLTPTTRDTVLRCAELGYTDKEMAAIVGVTQRTIDNWKKQDADFFQSLKDFKNIADQKVVASLYKKAKGYISSDIKLKEAVDENGQEVMEVVEVPKRIEPDTVSAIFWLKNRQPKDWRDKVDNVNHNVNETYEQYIDRITKTN